MSGQCGASHTSVTLYHCRTAKYGTGGDRHTPVTTQRLAHRCIYTTRDGWVARAGEERVHLFPSGHVSTELERFEGDDATHTIEKTPRDDKTV
ncbi:unnamed protein product [Lasius platythorax]|uniref:Uncharacterized protein n=1 Tax=Lasius platythorax TaxID=488582 RepID=A0AAV2NAB4_9HYME